MPCRIFKLMAGVAFYMAVLCSCASTQPEGGRNSSLSEDRVFAATTVPVSRMKIKIINNQPKQISRNSGQKPETPSVRPEKEAAGTAAGYGPGVSAKPEKMRSDFGLEPAQPESPVWPQTGLPSESPALTVYYANGSTALNEAERARIEKLAAEAGERQALVIIKGHSSSRTRDMEPARHMLVNFELSLQRAENVARQFAAFGVDAENIMVEACSDNEPDYLEVMPRGEQLNRRTEIFLVY